MLQELHGCRHHLDDVATNFPRFSDDLAFMFIAGKSLRAEISSSINSRSKGRQRELGAFMCSGG